MTVFQPRSRSSGDGRRAAEGPPTTPVRWVAAAVLVISESQELKQGVADLLLLVLSPLGFDKSFSFYPRTVGSRAPRLHPQVGSAAGNCMPGL